MRSGVITGGQVLGPQGVLAQHDLSFADGAIADKAAGGFRLDARGLLVLPGIVDVHGDAFERQLMPRPGVHFPIDMALMETDRQLAANGITTAFHAVTWSWEPGLRDRSMAAAMADALERLADRLQVDTRFHLRHECHNLAAETEIIDWLKRGRIAVLSFNDHIPDVLADASKPHKVQQYLDRSGLARAEWDRLVGEVAAKGDRVPASIERLAAVAREVGTSMMSHDDMSPEQRARFQALGVTVSEFPETEATAEQALSSGGAVVFGAPNVVRGKSHTTAPNATDMVGKKLCSVLASDYFYPALTAAPFRLAGRLGGAFERYWPLVSGNAARALRLNDRGELASGKRADIVLVDAAHETPRVVATLVAGRLVYFTEAQRLKSA